MTKDTQPEALRLAAEFKLCDEYDSIPSANDIAKAGIELARLHAENEALRKDAERMDWLRDNWFTMSSNYQGCITFQTGEKRWSEITEAELDAAIDAAMQATK